MAVYELRYVKTGAVPGREDLLFQGGDLNTIRMAPVSIFYVKTDDGFLLIDTSFDMEDAKVLGAEDAVKREYPDEDPMHALKSVGIEPQNVTRIILSHAHFDHVGYIDHFPKAKIYFHQKEFDWVMDLPSWAVGYGPFSTNKIKKVKDQLVLIDQDEYEVLPGINAIYVGGHSAGSLAVTVNTKVGKVCICGDNCFLYKNIEEKLPIGLTNNLYESIAFIEKLPELGDILIPGHDPQFFERFPDGLVG
jgi:glyoxylase-like metal-dependent hydrolase (beta-lactamase superfamily II)